MAAMIPTPFDLSRLSIEMTDESFGIPPHVIFQIVENGSLGQLHEVKAHNMILGMVSPTFRTMFYSTDVFDVVILVHRYQIVELMKAVKKHLINYPITDDTVLEVAEDAMEYLNMFEAEAEQLLLTCAKLLESKLKDVTRYASENKVHGETFAALLALMNDIAPTECPNCNKEICQDGEVVKNDAFRVGLPVTNNRASAGYSNWRDCEMGTGTVTMVGPTWVSVDNTGAQWAYSKSNNSAVPNFLFRCK